MIKRVFNVRNYIFFVLLTLFVSAIYVSVRIYQAPVSASDAIDVRVKSDYVLALVECILGMVAILLPSILLKKWLSYMPPQMITIYVTFLYFTIYLGEVHDYYTTIPNFDTIMHAFSGVALCAIGLSIINILNDSDKIILNLSPAFVAIFAFCFALAFGAIWEIYEFTIDSVFDTNMQRVVMTNGQLKVGQMALLDTMKDIIVDTFSALAMSIVGYISVKYSKGWIKQFKVIKEHRMINDGE
ncbi:MAG: hypothetical protein LBM38_05080 [Clostridiales bacterium]|jgi:hypothetical protein|nr:hypothetical protein [Clostridiales bacterium]